MADENGAEGSSLHRNGQKHLRNEQEWVRKKQKIQKDKGESQKGKHRPAKQLNVITRHCELSRGVKIKPPECKHICDKFYKVKNHDDRNNYLYGLLHKVDV